MKRLLVLLLALVFAGCAVYAGPGAAPNSGDGIPDGSGFEETPGPMGDGDPFGPAPNSGDGIPDGSGMDAPK